MSNTSAAQELKAGPLGAAEPGGLEEPDGPSGRMLRGFRQPGSLWDCGDSSVLPRRLHLLHNSIYVQLFFYIKIFFGGSTSA